MKLYKELAEWWPLMSPHTEYEEEASIFLKIIHRYHPEVKKALEFGSGGGSNAFYFKQYFSMTLSDVSPEMLAVSKRLNPECEHLQGDMREFEAGALFDLVFIHDAISYFTSEPDLRKVLENAKKHLKPDGILFIMPDQYKETFQSITRHGGTDQGERSMRYLEWSYDRNPDDHIVETEYVYVLKDEDGRVTREYDSEKSGLFSMVEWEKLLAETGFRAIFERIEFSEEPGVYFGIVAEQISGSG
ncbi:class I SAM-dependent methyltransferase [Planococcus salinus]|uniref:Class I SAM-dependent methyltransferase n=1 Tax=Planococcus salinus TaxID=1848460 RepID=A0A3M8P7P5_9BACL|nr:class I SAM-dependent methyltransferase [Planococcus salinus]RNF39718.1 class I SAM-dependent methyltransferase [Planococcus salinus]